MMVRFWHIEMLGGLRVVLPSAALSALPQHEPTIVSRFSTAKCAALLAYLVLHPRRAQSREELVALLWPDADFANGQASLRSALASLRRQLEPTGTPAQSLFFISRQTVRLNPDAFSTDVAEFEAAIGRGDVSRCRELYAGELLPGLYHDWVLSHRDRLAALWEGLPQTGQAAASVSDAPASPALPAPPPLPPPAAGRLPLTLSRCFGRESDISRVSEQLLGTGKTPARRFVTLTGPGGTGKTRLALEAARTRLAPAFGQNVFWASLADLTHAGQIAERIASDALHLPPPDSHRSNRLDAVINALAAYPCPLLVLDNLEQLTETSETAALIVHLLRCVPHLSLLATSRRRLRVDGEWEYPVAPLALPLVAPSPQENDPDRLVEAVANSAAVQLFVDRAQTARPDFAVTPRNAALIAELCERLDGLPLALELVAARSQSLTPAQMLHGLRNESGLKRFAASRRTQKEARHQSLHDAIAWSVRLLPPDLQTFWAGLSVFRGGFRVEAVCTVTNDENAGEYLTQLRERSLLVMQEVPHTTGGDYLRFGFLETLREFAGERLDADTRQRLAAAHAAYFADFAEATLPALQQKNVSDHLNALDAERPNFNAALLWCQQAGQTDETVLQTGLRLCAALWRFWEMRGYLCEGRAHLRACLEKDGATTEARANALNGAGMLAARQGDYVAARACHEECLRAYQSLGSRSGEAVALGNLGLLASEQSRYDEARALYEQSLHLRRERGDTFGIALMLNNLGNMLGEIGDHVSARAYLEESLSLHEKRVDKAGIAQALGNLGNAQFRAGNAKEAIRLHERGLAILTEINDKRGMAYALLNLGEMAQSRNDTTRACQRLLACLPLLQELGDKRAMAYALDSVAGLVQTRSPLQSAVFYGAASGLRETTGVHVPPVQQNAHHAALAVLQSAIGTAAYEAAFEKGRAQQDDATKAALVILQQFFRPSVKKFAKTP